MKDFNVVVKKPDGTEIIANTSMIEEDVIRMMMGLEPKEQD